MPHIGPNCCCEECDKVAAPFVICGIVFDGVEEIFTYNYQIRDADRAWIVRRLCNTFVETEEDISHFLDTNGDYDGSKFIDATECDDNCKYFIRAENCFGITTCGPSDCPDPPEENDCCVNNYPNFAVISFPDAGTGGCCGVMGGTYVFDPGEPGPAVSCDWNAFRRPFGDPDLTTSPAFWWDDVLPDVDIINDVDVDEISCFLQSDTTNAEGRRDVIKWFVMQCQVTAGLNNATISPPSAGGSTLRFIRILMRCTVRIYPDPPGPPPPPPTEVTREIFADEFQVAYDGNCSVGGTVTNPTRDQTLLVWSGGSSLGFLPPDIEDLCVTETWLPTLTLVVAAR